MRKSAITLTLLMACNGIALAANPYQESPETRAFLSYTFDSGTNEKNASGSGFTYGLRFQHDSRFNTLHLPPIAELNLDRYGAVDARLNGMPFVRRLSLQANEDGNSSGGMFSSFTAVDWGLVALGAVGVGFGIAAVVDQKDSPDPQKKVVSTTTNPLTGLTTTVTQLLGPAGQVLGTLTTVTDAAGAVVSSVTSLIPKIGFVGQSKIRIFDREDHGEWLNEHNGYMGDLTVKWSSP